MLAMLACRSVFVVLETRIGVPRPRPPPNMSSPMYNIFMRQNSLGPTLGGRRGDQVVQNAYHKRRKRTLGFELAGTEI